MPNSAIVTGFSAGLGQELAIRLLDRQWSVVGVSRSTEPDGLGSEHAHRLAVVHGSVDEQATVDAAFVKATAAGELKLVINCAGEGIFGEIGEYQASEIRAALAGNLAGLILFSDMAVRHMRESGGDIVNVMSTAGKKLRTAESVYVASKWGAKAYTRTLREAAKSQKLPIRVFEVYPCGMNTRFWDTATRPVAKRESFPDPGPIADQILEEVLSERSVYCQELVFERS